MKNNFLDCLDGDWSNVISDTYKETIEPDITLPNSRNHLIPIIYKTTNKSNIKNRWDLFNPVYTEESLYNKPIIFINYNFMNADYEINYSAPNYKKDYVYRLKVNVLFDSNNVKIEGTKINDDKYVVVEIDIKASESKILNIDAGGVNIYSRFTDILDEVFSLKFLEDLNKICIDETKGRIKLK